MLFIGYKWSYCLGFSNCLLIKSYIKPILAFQASFFCWIYGSVAHTLCAGLTTSVCPSRRVGIHYCCSGCGAFQKEMRSFIRRTKTGFKELLDSLCTISNELTRFENQLNSLQL